MCRINYEIIQRGDVGISENYISGIVVLSIYYHEGNGWNVGVRSYSSDYYDIEKYITGSLGRKLIIEERILLALSVGYITKEINEILPGIMQDIWPTPNILGISKSPRDIYNLLNRMNII